jgi:hypothetical protein
LEKQQEYIVQVDDFRLTQDKVYHQLNDIILEYIRTHKDKLATNLKNFYNSVTKMNSIDESKRLSKEAVQTIFNGALGAMTFGAYAQFQNEKVMTLNNQLQEQKMAKMLEENEKKIQTMLNVAHSQNKVTVH